MKYLIILSVVAATGFWTLSSFSSTTQINTSISGVAGGISFNELTLEKAKAEAKKKKKKIFIDVYTTWCGPCKEMAKTTFTDTELGKLFNGKFVNVKMDAENDADGSLISSTYKVTAYPTLLFLDENGKLIKKLVGKQSKEKLIQVANGM